MQRSILRAFCAVFAVLAFVLLFSSVGARVDARASSTAVPAVPQGVTQALTTFVPLASNGSTLSGSINVTTLLESAKAVTKTIPPGGGVITATGAGGDKYTLTLPNGALNVTTTVTLTPVQNIGSMPVGEFIAGVQIAPANLNLWQAATLRIEPKPAVAVVNQVSFAWFGAGTDFHLFPLTLDPTVTEFEITRLIGYGLGTTADAVVSESAAEANVSQVASWTPLDILANIAQRTQAIIQQMREDALAERPQNPELVEQFKKLMLESWTRAIQPMLAPMTTDCDTMKVNGPIVTGWLRQVQLLGGDEEYSDEARQIGEAMVAGLENCISEAAEPCFLMADVDQVTEILGYMRQLALLGNESDLNLDELPQCAEIHVTMGGNRTRYFNMAPDPETGWNTKALYLFDDNAAAGVLTVNPFAMVGTGSTGRVSMKGKFGDEWRPLSIFLDRWLCRDKAEERIDALIVSISDVQYAEGTTSPPVPYYLHVTKMGCWRWTVEQTYSDEYTENPDIAWTRDWTLATTVEFSGTEPFATWDTTQNKVQITFNPLKFLLVNQGTFDYAMDYTYSGESPCHSSLTAHKAPPVTRDPRFDYFTVNIDPNLEFEDDLGGGVEIVIDQPYVGNCGAWQNPLPFVSVSAAFEVDVSGRSAVGSDNGFLGEQSGVWDSSWSYTAQRE